MFLINGYTGLENMFLGEITWWTFVRDRSHNNRSPGWRLHQWVISRQIRQQDLHVHTAVLSLMYYIHVVTDSKRCTGQGYCERIFSSLGRSLAHAWDVCVAGSSLVIVKKNSGIYFSVCGKVHMNDALLQIEQQM